MDDIKAKLEELELIYTDTERDIFNCVVVLEDLKRLLGTGSYATNQSFQYVIDSQKRVINRLAPHFDAKGFDDASS